MAKIYLSSTYADLKPYREAVYRTLRALKHDAIAMEDYVATDQRPLDTCLADVAGADLYIGLFAWRYGFVPAAEEGNANQRSITELEYRKAIEAHKPRLIFLAEDTDWPLAWADSHTGESERGQSIATLREELRLENTVSFFRNPDELARQVSVAVGNWARSSVAQAETEQRAAPEQKRVWEGCPFPGLDPFEPQDNPIYFGREEETQALVSTLADPSVRFLAVVGASGSGKSSLVGAGLLPALENGAIGENERWAWIRFTPGERGGDPFLALTYALVEKFPGHGWRRRERELAGQLRTGQMEADRLSTQLLGGANSSAGLLVFVDQFEELFTLCPRTERQPFIDFLATTARDLGTPIRTVLTLRADFYAEALKFSPLPELLRNCGTFALGAPGVGALYQMIAGPAKQAGLKITDALINCILSDTGTEPGALALMAFTLRELYERGKAENSLTKKDYDTLGGVRGAIGQYAETVLGSLPPPVQEVAGVVFRELVEVDEYGKSARRRAQRRQVASSPEADQLVMALTEARLLVSGRGEADEPTIEVAHEALFTHWPSLATWLEDTRDDLQLLRQVRLAAADWEAHENDEAYLWHPKRLKLAWMMIKRLQPTLDEIEQDFINSEIERLMEEIKNPATLHQRRAGIGKELHFFRDTRPGVGLRGDGLPDIAWCQVPGGEVTLEHVAGTFRVEPFCIAKYLVTYAQYRCFLEAKDGYPSKRWWKGLADRADKPGEQYWKLDNHPAEKVSWYDAVAFCRWLSEKLGYEIRLPTEWEWQQAATGGNPANKYPWGTTWNATYANTSESSLSRTTAVGMYPQGVSPVGALDMAGNVWEWCLNEHKKPSRTGLSGDSRRVVRGGSWRYSQARARGGPRPPRPAPPWRRGRSSVCAIGPHLGPLITEGRVSGHKKSA